MDYVTMPQDTLQSIALRKTTSASNAVLIGAMNMLKDRQAGVDVPYSVLEPLPVGTVLTIPDEMLNNETRGTVPQFTLGELMTVLSFVALAWKIFR